MKRIAMFCLVAALLALAGCATLTPLPEGIKQLPGKISQEKLEADLTVPLCFNRFPFAAFFYKEAVGIPVTLTPEWMAEFGYSSIGGKAVPRSTFPAFIKDVSWGWLVMEKWGISGKGVLIVPNHNILSGILQGDIFVLSEKKGGHLIIPKERVDWSGLKDYSGTALRGKRNLQKIINRFQGVVGEGENDFTNTDLSPAQFRIQRKRAEVARRLGGAIPDPSLTLLFPPAWIPYGINWVGNTVASSITYGDSGLASVEEIRAFLSPYRTDIPEIIALKKALEDRKKKETERQEASKNEGEER